MYVYSKIFQKLCIETVLTVPCRKINLLLYILVSYIASTNIIIKPSNEVLCNVAQQGKATRYNAQSI